MPYIRRFHGKTIVVKYGGNAMIDQNSQGSFAHDVVLLKLVGMNPVVVHGGGPQIDEALERVGKKCTLRPGHARHRCGDHGSRRVGPRLARSSRNIVDADQPLRRPGGRPDRQGRRTDPRPQDAACRTRTIRQSCIDIGQVGEIEAINPAVVKALQDDAFIPVISPIGFGDEGQTYNINADVVAGKIAEILKAEKLVMLTNIAGRARQARQPADRPVGAEIDELFADGTISGGMLPKISSALEAAK